MPERDPIDPPPRPRKRYPIMPMKPYVEPPETKKQRGETLRIELRLAVSSLKNIWQDITKGHRE